MLLQRGAGRVKNSVYSPRFRRHFLAVHLSRKEWDAVLGRALLFLLLGILVYAPVALGCFYPLEFMVMQGMLVLALAVWGVRLWVSPRPQLLWPPICWVVVAFMVFAVARWWTADIEYVARVEVVQVLVLGFFFLAVLNNLFRQETTQVMVFTLVTVAVGICFLALYKYLHYSHSVWGVHTKYVGRAFGTYYSPNNFSCLLELLLPLVLAYVLAGRLKVTVRVLLGYAGVMMVAALVFTFSRGGWIATTAGLVTVLLLLATHRHHRRVALTLLLLLLAAGCWGGYRYSKHLASTSVTPGVSQVVAGLHDWDIRMDMWQAALHMCRDYPWFGVGPGHYNYRFREYRPEMMQLQPDRVHNDYLNLVTDWGVVGGLIILAGLGLFVAGLVETWRHVQRSEGDFNGSNSNRFAFFTGASGALAALSVHSCVDFNLHTPANAAIALAWVALLTSNQRFATERHWVKVPPRLRWGITMVLAAVILVLTVQGWRRTRENLWLSRADRQPPDTMAQAVCLEQAMAIEPRNFLTIFTLGDLWRRNSFDERDNYVELAGEALKDYRLSRELNPYYVYNYLYAGMTLDWIGRQAEATPYFRQAEQMDPNGTYVVACIGWHYAQIHDFAAAEACLVRSVRLDRIGDNTARKYITMLLNRLHDEAPGSP